MTLSDAIRELRRLSGKSQQVVATELGFTIRSLQFYEQGRRTPEPKGLLALAAYADTLDSDELYAIFTGDALLDQLVPPPGWEIAISFRRSPQPSKTATKDRTIRKENR